MTHLAARQPSVVIASCFSGSATVLNSSSFGPVIPSYYYCSKTSHRCLSHASLSTVNIGLCTARQHLTDLYTETLVVLMRFYRVATSFETPSAHVCVVSCSVVLQLG